MKCWHYECLNTKKVGYLIVITISCYTAAWKLEIMFGRWRCDMRTYQCAQSFNVIYCSTCYHTFYKILSLKISNHQQHKVKSNNFWHWWLVIARVQPSQKQRQESSMSNGSSFPRKYDNDSLCPFTNQTIAEIRISCVFVSSTFLKKQSFVHTFKSVYFLLVFWKSGGLGLLPPHPFLERELEIKKVFEKSPPEAKPYTL